MDISVVIRTYNEGRHLPELLEGIRRQELSGLAVETVLVDSGSTDGTLEIAESNGCRVVHIAKDDFAFGRSLNLGCETAEGKYLVFISGHCIPAEDNWLTELIAPLSAGFAEYSYGRQIGNGGSKFSECQLFRKYFPEHSRIPQGGFFCNNANAAIVRDVWREYRFDETLTGLEDMELGKRLVAHGKRLAYVASAAVYHLHDETWGKVRNRYEREAVALQQIMPEVHVGFTDFLRYFFSAILFDSAAALQDRVLHRHLSEIIMFRLMQYWGAYRGNHMHRKLSKDLKERYFFPK
jgi:glycosyltransferase involved in cell wall biosynthesis